MPFTHGWRSVSGYAMSYPLYQDTILTTDLLDHGVCAGDVGTLVKRHVVPARKKDTASNSSI